MTGEIRSEIRYIYFADRIVQGAFDSFAAQLYSSCDNIDVAKIKYYNDEVFYLINGMPLKYLFADLTSSDSGFYRFSILNTDYEFKLEVFFDYDENDKDDIQSTLHIYQSNTKLGSYYGSLEQLYKIITDTYEASKKSDSFFENASDLLISEVFEVA